MNMSFNEFILPLLQSMDTYNYLLKSHHRRVAVIAYAIGKQMKLPEKQLNELVIAAAMHDIGALNVQERDHILEADISDPKPHCEMGYEILKGFDLFANIATIIRHHHIFYYDLYMYSEEIPIQSHIIHVADRIEVYLAKDEPILEQKDFIRSEVADRSGELFHPQVCGAFELVSRPSSFWIMIKNMSMEELFSELNYGSNIALTPQIIEDFSVVLSRIVDFRSRCTAAHSLTVGNLAQYIGELMNKNKAFNDQLKVAGLLHDIGKFTINPGLITKQGNLKKDEYKELQKIPEYNRKMFHDLQNSPWFEPVLKWISKQESNDPSSTMENQEDQLGTNIIQLSHIITALREKRPYRDAYDMDKAIELMQQEITDDTKQELVTFIKQHKQEIDNIIQLYETDGLAFYDNIETEFEYY